MIDIITRPRFHPLNLIKKIEKKYSCKYICETSTNCNSIIALFYSENKHLVSGSHYMGFDKSNNVVFDGQSVADSPFHGILVDNEVFYSVHRHDMHERNGISIDGGRDYLKISRELDKNDKDVIFVELQIVGDKLEWRNNDNC